MNQNQNNNPHTNQIGRSNNRNAPNRSAGARNNGNPQSSGNQQGNHAGSGHGNHNDGNRQKKDFVQRKDNISHQNYQKSSHSNNPGMNRGDGRNDNTGRTENRIDNRSDNRTDNREFRRKPQQQRHNPEMYASRVITPKREETVDDIKMDIEKLEKDIQFEIKQIRSVKLGL
jgi:hypothetical protein